MILKNVMNSLQNIIIIIQLCLIVWEMNQQEISHGCFHVTQSISEKQVQILHHVMLMNILPQSQPLLPEPVLLFSDLNLFCKTSEEW